MNTVDATGATNNYTGVNSLDQIVLGTVLPINFTLTILERPGDELAITFFKTDYITYKVGDGPVGE